MPPQPPQPSQPSQPTLILQPAALYRVEQLTHAFNRGFEGYLMPITQTPDSLQRMIDDNDVRLEHSLVAVAPDEELVGVGLLALRGNAGEQRGWVAGMGVAPAWRGKGQGAALLRALIEQAREQQVGRLQLEVLAENEPAHQLYAHLGFQETRTLTVYTGAARMSKRQQPPSTLVTFRQIASDEALANFGAYHPAPPSWQREEATLLHMAERLEAIGMEDDTGLRAYALISRQPTGYAILDLGARATSVTARRADATALIGELLRRFPGALLRAINVVPGEPLGDALRAVRCPIITTQREMELPLI